MACSTNPSRLHYCYGYKCIRSSLSFTYSTSLCLYKLFNKLNSSRTEAANCPFLSHIHMLTHSCRRRCFFPERIPGATYRAIFGTKSGLVVLPVLFTSHTAPFYVFCYLWLRIYVLNKLFKRHPPSCDECSFKMSSKVCLQPSQRT